MLYILRREKFHKFICGEFNFQNGELNDTIAKYHDMAMKLNFLGRVISWTFILSQETQKFHIDGEKHLTPKKP